MEFMSTVSTAVSAVKELVPVVISAALWDAEKEVCFHFDNMSVVAVLKKGLSDDRQLMHLLRCLLFFSTYPYFSEHMLSVMNTAAALSQDDYYCFSLLFHRLLKTPILCSYQSSQWHNWTELFSCCLIKVSHLLHSSFITQKNIVFWHSALVSFCNLCPYRNPHSVVLEPT